MGGWVGVVHVCECVCVCTHLFVCVCVCVPARCAREHTRAHTHNALTQGGCKESREQKAGEGLEKRRRELR